MTIHTSVNSNKVRTNMYLNKSVKNQAQQIFKEYEIQFQLKIPKDNIPNKETIQALKDCENGIGLEEISFDDLQKDMKPKVS